MKRITFPVDDDLLAAGREYARKKGMKLSELIRQLLDQTVRPSCGDWLEELFALADKSGANSKGEKWTRDEIHERGPSKGNE